MRNTLAIAGREFRSFYGSPWAYLVTAIFLIISGYGFGWNTITFMESTIQGFLSWGSFFLLFLGPAMTMRLFAEEEKLGTMELLMTAPVRDIEVVLGKYLASLGMFLIMLALTLYYPLLLTWYGEPDWGPIFSGYLGIFLLGAVFLSIGLFASSVSSNQILAYVVGSAIVLTFWFIGNAARVIGETAGKVLNFISISNYFPAFGRGIIDTNAIIYYLSITAVFIFLTVRSIETRRWR
ncbi:MAG: ABC transporter permease subunit [Deltaproteobacteria bacterium]|nr:ABC transporter permease subunit [Deltaproteobacteria bacterium]